MNKEKTFIIMDVRYFGEPDRATILDACNTENEGLESLKEYPDGTVLLETFKDKEERIVKVKSNF